MNDRSRYDLLFRGDIVPGRRFDEVRAGLRDLFQIDDARAASLFSGRPVIVRRNLEAAEAERYRAALEAAGALVELRPLQAPDPDPRGSPPPGAASTAPGGTGWTLTPVGADLLRPDERATADPVQVDTSHLAVEPPGADVLRAEERRPVVAREVDTSRLQLDPGRD